MMIRRIKQTCLGVLLIVAALFTGCAKDAAVEQQRWHVSIKADRQGDDALTRSLYLDGTALKAQWTGSEVLKVYNSSNVEVGTLTASANLTGGSTTLTGDLTANVSIGDKLYIWSPSNTPDYATQDGTVAGANGISAKDYIKAEIEVEAKDDANHILNTTNATFEHQQSFTKFSVTPAVHSLKISATGMSDITATLDGTTEDNDFYVAMPNTGGSEKSFTFTGTTNASVAYSATKSKQLVDGNYYTGSMDLKTAGSITCTTSALSFSASNGANATITKTGVSCSGGSISVSSSDNSYCTVSYSSGTITVKRVSEAAWTATITVSLTPDANHTAPTDETFTVSATAYVDPVVDFDNVTSSHKGYYIAKNGKAYSTMALAAQYGTAAVARITYVGSVPGYFDNFLAIALEDASSKPAIWSTQMSAANTWASSHAVTVGSTTYNSCSTSAYDQVTDGGTTSKPKSSGAVKGWRVPSVTDWKYIFAGIGGKAVDNSTVTQGILYSSGTDSGGSDGSHRALLNKWCGQAWNATTTPQAVQSGIYGSSSERAEDASRTWLYNFNLSLFNYAGKSYNDYYVRAVFAY